jgi:hypothetical protein
MPTTDTMNPHCKTFKSFIGALIRSEEGDAAYVAVGRYEVHGTGSDRHVIEVREVVGTALELHQRDDLASSLPPGASASTHAIGMSFTAEAAPGVEGCECRLMDLMRSN